MTVEHLLDAAVEQFSLTGMRRTSADDIARRAGVNRATLYRRLGRMDEIVARAVLHETTRTLDRITRRLGEVPEPGTTGFDPVADIERFFGITLDEVRGNELLAQVMLRDREDTLVGLTERAGDIIALAASLSGPRIVALRHHVGNDRTDDVPAVAATLARLTQSLLLTPSGPPDIADDAARRAFVQQVIAPLVLGRPTPR